MTMENGNTARSAETRARLIDATIEIVGATGFEAASTRALAQAAKVNLSAIPYHFGGKRELYLAAASEIADYAAERLAEVTEILEHSGTSSEAGRLEDALIHLLNILLDDAEPRSWTPFIARCAYENDEAFAIIYNQALGPAAERLAESVAAVSGAALDGEDARLRANAILTAIASFRLMRGMILRGMDWPEIDAARSRRMEEMVRDLCRSSFLHPRQLKPAPRSKTRPIGNDKDFETPSTKGQMK